MSTMPFKQVTATVVYVDPSATGGNTGATPADALLTLPAMTSMTANTVYLIRRGQTVALTPGTCSQHCVGICGMPLSTDLDYYAIPAEAVVAWGADAATVATVTVPLASTAPTFSGSTGVQLSRIDLVSTQASTTIAVNFFVFTNCAMVSLVAVHTKLSGFDLIAATVQTGSLHLNAITFSTCVNVELRECIFERPVNTVANTPTALNGIRDSVVTFGGGPCSSILIEDCDFWYAFPPGSSCLQVAALRFSPHEHAELTLRNLRFHAVDSRWLTGSYYVCFCPAYRVFGVHIDISDVSVDARSIGTTAPINYQAGAVDATFSFQVANVGFFHCEINAMALTGGARISVRRVSVAASLYFATSGFGINANNGALGPGGSVTGAGSNRNEIRDVSFVCTSTVFNSNAPSTVGVEIMQSSSTVIDGIVSTYAPLSTAPIAIAINYAASMGNKGGVVRNVVAAGAVRVGGCSVDISTLTAPLGTTALMVRQASLVSVDELILPATWPMAGGQIVTAENGSTVLINSCNKPGVLTPGSVMGMVAVANADGVAGNWRAFAGGISVISNLPYRVGGAASALIVQSTVADSGQDGVWLAPYPLAGKALPPGGTGRRLVRVYIAIRGFATLLRYVFGAMQIFVEAPAGAYPNTANYVSCLDGWWEDDAASVWVNDTGLVQKRVVIPVNVDRLEDLKIRVRFRPLYELNAYYYVDPLFEVVAG